MQSSDNLFHVQAPYIYPSLPLLLRLAAPQCTCYTQTLWSEIRERLWPKGYYPRDPRAMHWKGEYELKSSAFNKVQSQGIQVPMPSPKGWREATRWKWNQGLSPVQSGMASAPEKRNVPGIEHWDMVTFFYWSLGAWNELYMVSFIYFFLILLLHFLNSTSCIIIWSVSWFKKSSGF